MVGVPSDCQPRLICNQADALAGEQIKIAFAQDVNPIENCGRVDPLRAA